MQTFFQWLETSKEIDEGFLKNLATTGALIGAGISAAHQAGKSVANQASTPIAQAFNKDKVDKSSKDQNVNKRSNMKKK